jgi:hypothetical protein
VQAALQDMGAEKGSDSILAGSDSCRRSSNRTTVKHRSPSASVRLKIDCGLSVVLSALKGRFMAPGDWSPAEQRAMRGSFGHEKVNSSGSNPVAGRVGHRGRVRISPTLSDIIDKVRNLASKSPFSRSDLDCRWHLCNWHE